ncbi:IC domain protein, HAD ATPase, P-type family [Ancylostoma duodenale]|uniref:IC domain protein, HAD ATPase, P-type family n=1 Tax=Ancylostoma duodenale TaxID=51022 RepID=A0A0C2C272_9BILA|nr:IC domain protein, HAD ATPase, P-type family [Ancylostoma duodenale]
MENRIKPVTLGVINQLNSSWSSDVVLPGPTFAVITHEYPEVLDSLVSVCDVFARMAPDQKQQLVNSLQEVGYTVAMCGDGANDCAALKAAHAGISLSDAEASIAAPFTSKVSSIL